MRSIRFVTASMAMLVAASGIAAGQSNPRVYSPQFQNPEGTAGNDAPAVEVWLGQNNYRFGDALTAYVRTDPGAYLTVVRVSTDGELRVLYPSSPSSQRRYRVGEFTNDRVPSWTEPAFYIRESSGNGFVFAIASYEKFDYRYYSSGGQWSMSRMASAARFGNPFEIIRSFAQETVGPSSEYSMDYVMYDVDARQLRSRYASRYRGYSYDDYYDLCLGAFRYGYDYYCNSYDRRYYAPYIIVNGTTTTPRQPAGKSMRVKRLVPDPVLPHMPLEPQAAEGRMPLNDPAEAAAMARQEHMLRGARPRVEMKAPSAPAIEPRRADPGTYVPDRDPIVSRPMPRSEPRNEPRIERSQPVRAEPREQPRVEVRNEPRQSPPPQARSEPAKVERRERDH